jgi:DNA-binding MarR family transcriptional regulator
MAATAVRRRNPAASVRSRKSGSVAVAAETERAKSTRNGAARNGTPRSAGGQSTSTAEPFYSGEGYRIDESVGYLMKLAIASMVRRVDRSLCDEDLTAVQVLPLLAIANGKVGTAAEMARLIGTDPGAATRMLDRLEAKDLICRARCGDDRRVVRLTLTTAGKRIADQLPFVMAEVLNRHLNGFSRSEFEQLRQLLRRVIANGEAMDNEAPTP